MCFKNIKGGYMSEDRTRRSAKQVIEDLTEEILRRPKCDQNSAKLDLIESIAIRMSWTNLFMKIKNHRKESVIQKDHWYQD